MYNIFSLAFQGVRRKKKSSILIFLVLLLSFSFAIASLSLLGSMSKTNAEFRLNTYGEWYFGIPAGVEQDAKWLEKETWSDSVGISRSYGTVSASRPTGFGTVDDTLKEIGRLKLEEGSWPQNANEIAMEADILGILGYDYSLGQEITLPIILSCGGEQVYLEKTYLLCGLIREYTDLWMINQNAGGQLLNGAIVTEEAASQVYEDARELYGRTPKSVPQYFIKVSEEKREQGRLKLEEQMSDPSRGGKDRFPCQNLAAYSDPGTDTKQIANANKTVDNFYIYAIAVVALLAVLCIYIMQLPAEIHSFAILRSIGITRLQMARLLLTESMLLCIPAVLLGIPLGMGLTWVALGLTMYAGSVPVQVEIPLRTMGLVIVLWIVMILLSRLIVYAATVRTPLTGTMQMQRGKSRRIKSIRSGFIMLLLGIFGAVTIFTSIEVLTPKHSMNLWASYPSYTIWVGHRDSIINNNPCVLESQLELIEKVPGIANARGISNCIIEIAFDGMEIGRTSSDNSNLLLFMYAIDAADWEDTFHFETDKERFDRGELVLLCFPDKESPIAEAKEDFILPSDKLQIRAYTRHLYQDFGAGEPVTPKPALLLESDPTAFAVRYLSYDAPRFGHIFEAPYTVICSNAYIEKLTTHLKPREPGESDFEPQWQKFSIDREVGYEDAMIFTAGNAGDMSTDKVIAQLCHRENLGMDNRRQENHAHIQENLQKILLLCSSGLSIACMALLICYSALSLETEQEKRYFRTMRIIGMSSGQMIAKIVGKALYRSGIAAASGWICYFAYLTVRRMQNEMSFGEAIRVIIPRLLDSLRWSSLNPSYLGMVTLVCLFLPFVLSVLAKLKLRKENWIA